MEMGPLFKCCCVFFLFIEKTELTQMSNTFVLFANKISIVL